MGSGVVRSARVAVPWRASSDARNKMLSAIVASTGAGGTCTKPSVAAASVTLCASVNAVTVATSRPMPRTSSSSASTNRR